MAPSDNAISVAKTLIETVMIVLPIWLASIRYFFDEFEDRSSINVQFSPVVLLVYVALASVLVSSGVVITDMGDSQLSSSIYGLWFLFFSIGAFTFWFIKEVTDDTTGWIFNWFGILAGLIFGLLSLFLMLKAGL